MKYDRIVNNRLKELRKLDAHTCNKMYEAAIKEIKLNKSKRAKALNKWYDNWINPFSN
tara:strand:+ start:524 stop:697 length:174 start_codon:yes stop_codon:yes gene_type:complete